VFVVVVWCTLMVNHDFCAKVGEKMLKELVSNSRKSVFVGHHNFADSARVDGVQKLAKSFALEVDA